MPRVKKCHRKHSAPANTQPTKMPSTKQEWRRYLTVSGVEEGEETVFSDVRLHVKTPHFEALAVPALHRLLMTAVFKTCARVAACPHSTRMRIAIDIPSLRRRGLVTYHTGVTGVGAVVRDTLFGHEDSTGKWSEFYNRPFTITVQYTHDQGLDPVEKGEEEDKDSGTPTVCEVDEHTEEEQMATFEEEGDNENVAPVVSKDEGNRNEALCEYEDDKENMAPHTFVNVVGAERDKEDEEHEVAMEEEELTDADVDEVEEVAATETISLEQLAEKLLGAVEEADTQSAMEEQVACEEEAGDTETFYEMRPDTECLRDGSPTEASESFVFMPAVDEDASAVFKPSSVSFPLPMAEPAPVFFLPATSSTKSNKSQSVPVSVVTPPEEDDIKIAPVFYLPVQTGSTEFTAAETAEPREKDTVQFQPALPDYPLDASSSSLVPVYPAYSLLFSIRAFVKDTWAYVWRRIGLALQ